MAECAKSATTIDWELSKYFVFRGRRIAAALGNVWTQDVHDTWILTPGGPLRGIRSGQLKKQTTT